MTKINIEENETRDYAKNPITLQEIFNKAWQRFIVEGAKPCAVHTSDTFSCRYRDGRGGACAIGLCIPSLAILEGSSAVSIVARVPELFDKNVRAEDVGRLQKGLHDRLCTTQGGEVVWAYSLEERKSMYRGIAMAFSLYVPLASKG